MIPKVDAGFRKRSCSSKNMHRDDETRNSEKQIIARPVIPGRRRRTRVQYSRAVITGSRLSLRSAGMTADIIGKVIAL